MTSRHEPMGELELDAVMRTFLAEGAGAPVQRIAERAMDAVRTTPQVRPRLAWPRPTVRPARGSVAAGLVVALVVGIGAVILSAPPVGPAAPSAGVTPSAELTVVGSGAGYRLLVPRSWVAVASGFDDARKWVGPDGELMVSYGASILDSGAVTQCGPPTPEWPLCMTETYGYTVPFDPAVDGVAPLSLEGFVRDRCLGGCDVTTSETTLGGELAEQNRTVAAGQRVTYVSTFRDRRPVILYWSEPESAADSASLIDAIRSSFEFLDPPIVSQTPFVDPTELLPYADTEVGYEVLIPRFWGEGTEVAHDHPDVHRWGAGRGFGTRNDPALTISVGAPDGTVTICQDVGHQCQVVVARTLDELDELLVSVPADLAGPAPTEVGGELVIADEPGRFKRPGYAAIGSATGLGALSGGGSCLGCPGMLYHAFTIKDGRPIVLSIDYWTIAFEELRREYILEILASFRLTD
jgi:hypothetical protein